MRIDHYLRPLVSSTRPSRMVYFDTESYQVPLEHQAGDRQLYALGVGLVDDVDDAGRYAETGRTVAHTPVDLWRWITDQAHPRTETRVWAHNLMHDLTVAQGWGALAALGWRCNAGDFAVTNESCWAVWRGPNRRRLVLVDSTSFLAGVGLERVRRDLGLPARPDLPAAPFDRQQLLERCTDDVETLAAAIRSLVVWLDEIGAGSLSRTGPGQAMNHYRSRYLERGSIVAHSFAPALEAERRALWTGRCEAWRWGRFDQPLDEWDFELAYPTLALEALPARFSHPLPDCRPVTLERARRRHQLLLEVDVTTDVPVLPCRLPDGSVCWPVGTWQSTVWDCEADLAESAGAQLRVNAAFAYRPAPVLEGWARWVIGQVQGDAPNPLMATVAKSWARTLIGRFALRYSRWEAWSTAPVVDRYGPDSFAMLDLDTGAGDSKLFDMGGVWWRQSDLVESDSSVPAITSRIAARARVRLWDAMQVAGDGLVYVDTDSVLTTRDGSRRLRAALRAGSLEGLRLKARYSTATVYGVRQLVLEEHARAAGLSRKARRVAPNEWVMPVWERVTSVPGVGVVQVVDRPFTMTQGDGRRRRRAAGETAAVVVESGAPAAARRRRPRVLQSTT